MRLAQEVGKVLLAQVVQVQMEVLFGRGYPWRPDPRSSWRLIAARPWPEVSAC